MPNELTVELIETIVDTLTRALNAQHAVNEATLAMMKETAEQLAELRARIGELEETLERLMGVQH